MWEIATARSFCLILNALPRKNGWMIRFIKKLLLTSLLLPSLASTETNLTDAQASKIGEQIWQNEGLGRVDYLAVWNQGEAFPSFGIGHFIWYPAGVDGPFLESFPALREIGRASCRERV